jgi:hypothetical protein
MGLFDDNKKKIKDSILNDPALGENTDDGYYNGVYQKDLKKKGFNEIQYEADYNSVQSYSEENGEDDY